MTFFLGKKGNVRLRRFIAADVDALAAKVNTDDVRLSLNRLGINGSISNLFTGDKVNISTKDPRGLDFIPASNWSVNKTQKSFSAFVNVNAAGAKIFSSFADAVNNVRANEIALESFTGSPISVEVRVQDFAFNVLGNVTNFEFQSNREAIDTTTLSDRFRHQYSAGIISGSGRIDCAFDYITSGINETPKLLLQLIQRVDLGCSFDLALYLTDKTVDPNVDNVFYLLTAVVANSGITVDANELINCSIDFVTTGDLRLVVGKPSEFILKENDDPIQLEQTVDFLLQDDTD